MTKIGQRLILHIGLHKTGSTSFQHSCFSNRNTLKQYGILYPDCPSLNGGTAQHVLLVSLLRRTHGVATFIETLRNLEGVHDSKYILLSAENLSSFLIDPADAACATDFIAGLNYHFQDWKAFAVIRDGPEMLRSILMQNIESQGYPPNLHAMATASRNYQFRQCRILNNALGNRLTAIDYAELQRASFCRSLIQVMTGLEVNIPELQFNVTQEKDVRRLIFSANIRRFWADALQAMNPYTGEVNQAVAHTMNSLQLAPREEEHIRAALAAKLDSVVREVMCQPESRESLMLIFSKPENKINAPP